MSDFARRPVRISGHHPLHRGRRLMALTAVVELLRISACVFADESTPPNVSPQEPKVCGVLDVACNLGKVGKAISKLPSQPLKHAIAKGYEPGTQREILCYGDGPEDVPVYVGGGRVSAKLQSCATLIELGAIHRIDGGSSAKTQADATKATTTKPGQAMCRSTVPVADGTGDQWCVYPLTGKIGAREHFEKDGTITITPLDKNTSEYGLPLHPGQSGGAQGGKADWDQVDRNIAEGKAKIDEQSKADDAQRAAMNDARRTAAKKCSAMLQDAVKARMNGDNSKMEAYKSCVGDIPK